ncbi:MAG TPA: hypothetical protein VMX36_09185 [Sedimentisphaerales bacterium]|nr:hypothetical protein [Sedimentisphaerales bacterium]
MGKNIHGFNHAAIHPNPTRVTSNNINLLKAKRVLIQCDRHSSMAQLTARNCKASLITEQKLMCKWNIKNRLKPYSIAWRNTQIPTVTKNKLQA